MKKLKYILFVLMIALILPIHVNAEEKDKINVYFFHGDGCTYCESAKEFFSGLNDEYKSKISIKMYETWYNEANAELLEKVGKTLEEEISGVPYIVIGDQSFSGYSSSLDESIKEAINKEYDSEEKYTAVDDLVNNSGVTEDNINQTDESSDTQSQDDNNTTDIIITVVSILVIVGFVVLVVVARKKK